MNERCIDWGGTISPKGYGYAYIDGRPRRVNRWAYEKFNGPIPDVAWVLHTCDRPQCINPLHLYAGDAKQNAKDRDSRLRNHNANKTHCSSGHPFEGSNLEIRREKRECRECRLRSLREASRRHRTKMRNLR